MLILSRKISEAICVGKDIRVTVVSIGAGRVKLGVEAPQNVTVDREEIAARRELLDPNRVRRQARERVYA